MDQPSTVLNHCQFCRSQLTFVAPSTPTNQPDPQPTQQGSRIEESFILLDDALAARRSQFAAAQHDAPANRSVEESFMIINSSTAALKPGAHPPPTRVALAPVFAALERICAVAEDDTRMQQPLCLDCSDKVQRELESQVREVRAEVHRYEATLAELDGQGGGEQHPGVLPEEEFAKQLAEAQAEEAKQRQRCEELQARLNVAQAQLAAAEAAAGEVHTLEQRYWHEYNDFQLQLGEHVQERGFLLAKTDTTTAQLERLRGVNVYNDIFFIWHDGPFGTISGFRLGRTPLVNVEWDEINAAWGQAVLLLSTIAQVCKLSFTHRLMPMGSYPRIADKKSTYDLFGPVSKLYCTSYDRAMICFLACIKEFAEFAAQRDSVSGYRQMFELPYAIEGDKVGGRSIKLMFNKDERWTKALKYMLTDLKWCLEWMVLAQEQQSFG